MFADSHADILVYCEKLDGVHTNGRLMADSSTTRMSEAIEVFLSLQYCHVLGRDGNGTSTRGTLGKH